MKEERARSNRISRLRKSSIFAELSFSDDGKKLCGVVLRAQNEDAEKVMDDIMMGRIKGLEYCEAKSIKMTAGGGDTHCFVISDQ